MDHVVIQDPVRTFKDIYSLDILCRCRATKHPPYEKVNIGDTIYVQLKGGPVKVKYTVSSVISVTYNSVEEVRQLCKGTSLFGATSYWHEQKNRCYGTIVKLTDPQIIDPPIQRYASRGDANDWIILDKKEKRRQWHGL
jgi:hypothetical protein